ncbi:MAG: bifunctional riboflavin kinase/FAD synthetase [Bacteroidia bacterium]|nr:bifunctional riboflavin kinase/FAD synthetase [Bacteroidia bacterium]MCZ2247659.1 bifunctional riboflavin kinase/FAD synthetase [Bacteroidia bacterium]
MKIHYSLDSISDLHQTAVTTGTFDGVHLGHKVILDRLNRAAHSISGESVLLTFNPHPRMILFPDDNNIKLLNTAVEKEELLNKCGIHHLVVLPFTKEFSRMSSLDYVRNILVKKLKAKRLVIGYDHHFGRNREGSFLHLQEYGPLYGFDVEEIPAHDINHVAISSSKIRQALETGDLDTANTYLGYHYQLSGEVVHGSRLGHTLGFPTANIKVNDKYKLIPAFGIYAAKVKIKSNFYKGILSIGKNPTVTSSNDVKIEVYILDFKEDIYGENIDVFLWKRLREEIKFNSVNELIEQMKIDKQETISFFNNHE